MSMCLIISKAFYISTRGLVGAEEKGAGNEQAFQYWVKSKQYMVPKCNYASVLAAVVIYTNKRSMNTFCVDFNSSVETLAIFSQRQLE